MSAHACLAAAALVVAPMPPETSRDPGDEALELYDKGAYLEAAAAASAAYLAPGEPAARRLQNARLAQEAFSRAFETAATPRPDYLCRALDVLDATAALAVEPDDIRRHRALADLHRATLKARHPAHRCEVGTELRPILGTAPAPPPPAPVAAPRQVEGPVVNTEPHRYNSAGSALKLTGAVSMTLGVAALAAMAGGLVIRSQATKAAGPLDAARDQQGYFTPIQGHLLAALTDVATAGQRMALAGGISGAVLLVLGAALVGRGHVVAARARVAPMAGSGRAGLILEGRF